MGDEFLMFHLIEIQEDHDGLWIEYWCDGPSDCVFLVPNTADITSAKTES